MNPSNTFCGFIISTWTKYSGFQEKKLAGSNTKVTQIDYKKAWEVLINKSYQLDSDKLLSLLDNYGICSDEDLSYASPIELTCLSACLKPVSRKKFRSICQLQATDEFRDDNFELKSIIWSHLQNPEHHKTPKDSQLLYKLLSEYGMSEPSHLSGLTDAMVTKLASCLKEAPKNDFLHDCKLLLSQPRLKPSSHPGGAIYPHSAKVHPITSSVDARLLLASSSSTSSREGRLSDNHNASNAQC